MLTEQEIRLVANQKLIIVNKADCDVENLYCKINLQVLNTACYRLQSKAGFKLYIYLAKNKNKYTFALSGTAFQAWAGVGKTAYDTAVAELINCGYLKLRAGKKRTYDFYEDGQEKVIATNPKVQLKVDINKDIEIHKKEGFEF